MRARDLEPIYLTHIKTENVVSGRVSTAALRNCRILLSFNFLSNYEK